MIDPLEITPVAGPVCGSIRPPGSKSLTNRALVLAALADGPSRLTGALDSQDTRVMIESLGRLGIDVRHDPAAAVIEVTGANGRPPAKAADLWLENSGTSLRFLTALCTLGGGRFRLDGNTRMRQRPIRDLVDALNALGADVQCERNTDCPPVIVNAGSPARPSVGTEQSPGAGTEQPQIAHGRATVATSGLPGGVASVAGSISSQYLSALLMAAPCAQAAVELHITGELVSRPYVEMTLGVMASFGVSVDTSRPNCFRIEPQAIRAAEYDIEPDASAASYFFAAAAITGGEVTVEGLSRRALQGDVAFVDALERMGCRVEWKPNGVTVRGGELHGIDIDMNAISDTAQTLAAVACFADGATRIRNVAHMRHKETDRVEAVAAEIRRLRLDVEVHADGVTIHPGPITPATIHTYDDHRMAMSFALVGLNVPGIRIADPGCVSKTYPRYFEDLERLCRAPR